jgi:hypothetical protein
VKELLIRIDEQLTILTIRVFPRGSDVSIDAGPFIGRRTLVARAIGPPRARPETIK